MEQDALGAPGIPPTRVAVGATAFRRALLDLHRRTAPPPVRVLEALFASFDAHALRALIALDVPDVLTRSMSMSELADRTGSTPADLERLVRYAAGRRLIKIDRRGRVRPTGVTKALRSGATAPWRGWVRFAASDWFDAAWRNLAQSIAKDAPGAFELAHGAPFFEFTTRVEPAAGHDFDQAMTAGATLQGIALARTLDWSDTASVCDVGGGRGAALDVIQRYHPQLNATLFDLPEVVAQSGFDHGAGTPRRSAIGGSFFEEIPAGHDRYLMLAIIHDWDDAQVAAILTNVRDAMGGAGEAVVVENVASKRPRDDFATASDLLMFVLASGRERTRSEYSELFDVAGLRIEEERMLPTGATAFTLRTAATRPVDPAVG